MARYEKIAADMRTKVIALAKRCEMSPTDVADLAYIINLAVRCAPRAVHSTVRRNIVAMAVKDYCRVDMLEEYDALTKKKFHRIRIQPNGMDPIKAIIEGDEAGDDE